MKKSHTRSKANRLPFSTIQAAVEGDPTAINKIVDHYEGYISKLSTKLLFDHYGNVYKCIDEEMRRRLQTKLIAKILNFKLC